MTLAVSLGLGAVIGILLGLLGGGGSILAVPALVYGLGLDIEQAIPISLLVIGVASIVGALPKVRAHQIEWRLAGIFAAAGIPATFAGSAVGRLLPQSVVLIGFAAVMIAAAARMLLDPDDTGTACKTGDSGINWRRCATRSIPAGITVGFLTGLFGVGGGFLIIVANSAAGLLSHLGGASIDWTITAAFAGAAIAASLLAGHVGTRVDTLLLQRWFAYLVFAVATYVLVDTLFLR